LLRNAGENIAGLVLNKIDTSADKGDLAATYASYTHTANPERPR
jgi:hypothetical protein